MTTLRDVLARFGNPVDVDSLRREVDSARRAAAGHRDALRDRIRHCATGLMEATAATRERSAEVARVDGKTRGGLVGTLLSSVNSEGVDKLRADAEFKLSGDLAVLERHIEDAHVLREQVPRLADDARFGAEIFEALRQRAIAGELEAELVRHIEQAGVAIGSIAGQCAPYAGPLLAPLQGAEAVAEAAAATLGRLRSSGRASTLGEAVLDGVISPDSGALGQLARRKAQEAAPGLVPELERSGGGVGIDAEIDRERAEARQRARRDAEARRLAEAELDALEWDG